MYRPYRAGALVQWLKLPAWKVGDRKFVSRSVIQVSKKHKFCVEPPIGIVGSLHDREVAYST